ncbi:MAG TPA: acyl-CoA dehydrogenase family protein [Mycobacteriales bacterium]|nr:acyl-CoA dehydrogenase family protein [Mycobacteriales bacterium]
MTGLDLTLPEELTDLRGLVADLLEAPGTVERLQSAESTDERFDRAAWKVLADAGVIGVAVAEEHGGLGLGQCGLHVALTELGRRVVLVPLAWTAVAAAALATHASPELRDAWVGPAIAGDAVLTVAPPVTVAGLVIDGGTARGTVPAVPWAHLAGLVLLPARDGLYALDPTASGARVEPAASTSREMTAHLHVDGAPVTRIGDAAAARDVATRLRVALASIAGGATDAALRQAADHTSSREQFGKPLSTFQGVALKAADSYVDTTVIQTAALQASWALDEGHDATGEALAAAWWAADGGQRCVHVTQHLHGGIGADITYPVHRYFLWVKQIELLLGGASALLAELGDWLATAPAPGDATVLT